MATVKEIENTMHECAIRKEQMQELCRREDRDIFDIVYNIAKGYLEKDAPDLMNNLQNAAIRGKRIDIDSTKSSYQKKQNYARIKALKY